jgi:uncharacterized protein YbaR (Trm112 family)
MFIELTDHLRCPSPHAEQFLVLLPGAMDGRRVVGGSLGCPVCGRVYGIAEGVADFGDGTPTDGRTAITAEALAAFLGVSGPGGYVALAGGVTALAPELAALLPGVRVALVNPPAGVADSPVASVLRAARLPLKSSSMRGVALGADAAADPAWVADAVRAVLPGLRVVVEGGGEAPEGVEVLAHSAECWVGKKQGARELGS